MNFFNNNLLEILEYQDFEARITISGFSVELFSTVEKLSVQNFLVEIKSVYMEKYGFKYRQKSKNQINFSNHGNVRILMRKISGLKSGSIVFLKV